MMRSSQAFSVPDLQLPVHAVGLGSGKGEGAGSGGAGGERVVGEEVESDVGARQSGALDAAMNGARQAARSPSGDGAAGSGALDGNAGDRNGGDGVGDGGGAAQSGQGGKSARRARGGGDEKDWRKFLGPVANGQQF